MTTVAITFDLTSSDYTAPLGFELKLNGKVLVNYDHVTAATPVSIDIPDDDDGDHELEFVLKNKTPEMTKIDESGNITRDVVLTINNLSFDGIKLGYALVEHSKYYHNGNGSRDPVEDKFYGDMGCNGSVILKFATPVHFWFLEILSDSLP